MLTRPLAAAIAGALLVAPIALSQRTTFTGVGQYPGAIGSTIDSLSADGRRGVGGVGMAKTGSHAVLWERGVGLSLLNLPADVTNNACVDISADGEVYLARHAQNGLFHASRQVGAGKAMDIGLIAAGVGVLPYAVSADGRFVVGEAEFPVTTGFVWDATTGEFRVLEGLDGITAAALGVSANGAVVAGECLQYVGQIPVTHAVRWIKGESSARRLEGDVYMLSRAMAVSDDGEWIVGTVGDTNGRTAYRWSEATGFELLGSIAGDAVSEAMSVSADGSVIVGVSANSEGERSFVWREGHGMTGLHHLLRQRNAIPGSWPGLTAFTLSADGTTVCGFGTHSGLYEGFVATLGCFADYDNNGFLTGVDFDSFVRQFELGTFRADLNADGFVTGEDFDNFVAGFLEGC